MFTFKLFAGDRHSVLFIGTICALSTESNCLDIISISIIVIIV